jgi:hypothetical protein
MNRFALISAALLFAGAGCLSGPAITPVTTETYPPAVEEAPPQAPDPNGPEAKADLVVADIAPGDQVASPLTVTGKARGPWYFEASFPMKLLDGNGNQLVITPAQAQSDWMTTDFVPFSVTLTFPPPSTATGTLILQKDNPSGEPMYDDFLAIPVTF